MEEAKLTARYPKVEFFTGRVVSAEGDPSEHHHHACFIGTNFKVKKEGKWYLIPRKFTYRPKSRLI